MLHRASSSHSGMTLHPKQLRQPSQMCSRQRTQPEAEAARSAVDHNLPQPGGRQVELVMLSPRAAMLVTSEQAAVLSLHLWMVHWSPYHRVPSCRHIHQSHTSATCNVMCGVQGLVKTMGMRTLHILVV